MGQNAAPRPYGLRARPAHNSLRTAKIQAVTDSVEDEAELPSGR